MHPICGMVRAGIASLCTNVGLQHDARPALLAPDQFLN
ncbi:hypothetical protein BN2475_450132 [Paraburkholderia ribeironis]|uniref:Uncharacterized protein n=1 Tax=Paraburkholderia ribeironis TaxID=1247936 RepID=A0A1N7S937_9BURK|nr:hypothetical protein BN2475_450132 [Paraburkholderia ribeironis]